jgi:hypothetical protein
MGSRIDLDIFQKRNHLSLPGIEPRILQSVARSLYSNIRAPLLHLDVSKYVSLSSCDNMGREVTY